MHRIYHLKCFMSFLFSRVSVAFFLFCYPLMSSGLVSLVPSRLYVFLITSFSCHICFTHTNYTKNTFLFKFPSSNDDIVNAD